ncbi:MAG: hypothetical protein E6R03_04555 [Hyphomicrobiaceae bacterium]|nr:MAG: hypothetical protein E6R03_04555 [Hyphomicrobiaceae bacterium]
MSSETAAAIYEAVYQIDLSKSLQRNCEMSPYEAGRHREHHLCTGLIWLAGHFGKDLCVPLYIDAHGEIPFNLVHIQGKPSPQFGEGLAEWLNKITVRTGVIAGAVMDPSSNWCRINHFEAERLLRLFAEVVRAESPMFDNTQATAEGWGLFNGYDLQRCDEQGRFEDDDAALAFVAQKAIYDLSPYHCKALRIALDNAEAKLAITLKTVT